MVAATLSAGPALRILAVGLLEEITLESARRLAETTYAQIVDTISLNDRRKPESRIDTILRIRPDLVILTGGTNGGASQSVMDLLEAVGLASYMLPDEQRPAVLYAGNQGLRSEIESSVGTALKIEFAPNIRPRLDVEQLDAAQIHLANIYRNIRGRSMPGVHDIDLWARGGLLPAAAGLGRVVRFLSKVYDASKGVLGVDIGAGATTLAAAFTGELSTGVYPQFGLGEGLPELLRIAEVEQIARWMHLDIPLDHIREYAHQKALYPASIPATAEDLAIEQALAREAIRQAYLRLAPSFPASAFPYGEHLTPLFEPVLVTGSVLTRAPERGQALLILLDGLQPTGVTTLVLDQHHLASTLGAAGATNPLLSVQVLETNAFVNLGTVISPVGEARHGTPVLKVRMSTADGQETRLEVKQGSLEVIPLPVGQKAQLQLTPLHRYSVGMGGPGRGGGLRIVGGLFGVVIDARGCPLALSSDGPLS